MAPSQSPKGAINRAPTGFAWLLPITGIILLLAVGGQWQPRQRLLGATLGLLYLFKLTILLKHANLTIRQAPVSAILLFLALWPGMDPSPFLTGRVKCFCVCKFDYELVMVCEVIMFYRLVLGIQKPSP